jgi:hypothetical protein
MEADAATKNKKVKWIGEWCSRLLQWQSHGSAVSSSAHFLPRPFGMPYELVQHSGASPRIPPPLPLRAEPARRVAADRRPCWLPQRISSCCTQPHARGFIWPFDAHTDTAPPRPFTVVAGRKKADAAPFFFFFSCA